MTTEELTKKIKYYDVLVTGAVELDANKNVVKDANGNPKIKWMREGSPSPEVIAAGLGGGRFFQCEFVERNIVATTLAVPEGGTVKIGPLATRGVPRNLFERQQREPFNAIAEQLIAGEFKIVKDPVGGANPVQPVARIMNYVQPGKQVEYGVGFEYYLHQRSRVSHKDEPIMSTTYRDGKLVKDKVIRTTGTMFLFGNELEIEDSLIAAAIKSHIPFKVPAASGVREVEEAAKTAADDTAQKEVPTI